MIHPVYVVRHGESEWNARGVMQGQTAHPALTARGREQSAEAARTLRQLIRPDLPVLVSSSDLRRAVQTAEVLGAAIPAELCFDRRLRERCLGELEGRDRADGINVLDALRFEEALLGGESAAEVAQRAMSCLLELDRAVVNVVVTHGEVIRALDELVAVRRSGGARTIRNGHVVQLATLQAPDTPSVGWRQHEEVR